MVEEFYVGLTMTLLWFSSDPLLFHEGQCTERHHMFIFGYSLLIAFSSFVLLGLLLL